MQSAICPYDQAGWRWTNSAANGIHICESNGRPNEPQVDQSQFVVAAFMDRAEDALMCFGTARFRLHTIHFGKAAILNEVCSKCFCMAAGATLPVFSDDGLYGCLVLRLLLYRLGEDRLVVAATAYLGRRQLGNACLTRFVAI